MKNVVVVSLKSIKYLAFYMYCNIPLCFPVFSNREIFSVGVSVQNLNFKHFLQNFHFNCQQRGSRQNNEQFDVCFNKIYYILKF